MTNAERTKAHVETLKESVAQDVRDLATARAADRAGILQHMRWCAQELAVLVRQLEEGHSDSR